MSQGKEAVSEGEDVVNGPGVADIFGECGGCWQQSLLTQLFVWSALIPCGSNQSALFCLMVDWMLAVGHNNQLYVLS